MKKRFSSVALATLAVLAAPCTAEPVWAQVTGCSATIGIGRHDGVMPVKQIQDRAGQPLMPGAAKDTRPTGTTARHLGDCVHWVNSAYPARGVKLSQAWGLSHEVLSV